MKRNYLKDFKVVHVNKPNEEQIDKVMASIQEYFDTKYGKVAQKKEKPIENFSLDNCTTKIDLMQERNN